VDAGVHHLQGKAVGVRPAEIRTLLEQIYLEKLALQQRHVAGARSVSDYDINNTYQYVINREDVHLAWLRDAIAAAGGSLPAAPAVEIEDASMPAILAGDRDRATAFIERWKSRIPAVTNARHRTMLKLLMGETREHERFFAQAAAGRTDLLGRRADGMGTGGGVLPTRWVE
jgi:hypothetical protein